MIIFDLITFGIVALATIYVLLVEDAVHQYRISKDERSEAKRQKEEKQLVATRLAQIKLTSSDDKEIETFIVKNAAFLSDPVVAKLTARISQIRNDRELSSEDARLKSKFNPL